MAVPLVMAAARIVGLHAGDRISLESPTGPVELDVAGVVDDFISERGNIIVSRRLVATRWRDPRVTRMHVFLAPGTTVEAARAAITDAVGRRYRLKVLDLDQTIDYHNVRVERAFAFTRAIQLLVVINFPFLLGYQLDFHFASGAAAWSVALVLAMTAFAGWAAARQAVRQEVLAGIRTE